MSSLLHPMESADSSQSLMTPRQSEMSSHYVVESGVFMSSFTATIFIAALITTGILMLTLLIALTVMLKSCQSSSSGILEHIKETDQYDYCSSYIFHAELNNLEEAGEFPICNPHANQYTRGNHYLQALNVSLWLVEEYFSRLAPADDGMDVILLDADDLLLFFIRNFSGIRPLDWDEQLEETKQHQAHIFIISLYTRVRASGWSFILFTRKPSKHLSTLKATLISYGYVGWASLIVRSDAEIQMEDWEFLSNRRLLLQKQGFRIAGLISSYLDTFRGSYLASRCFKLPNILHY